MLNAKNAIAFKAFWKHLAYEQFPFQNISLTGASRPFFRISMYFFHGKTWYFAFPSSEWILAHQNQSKQTVFLTRIPKSCVLDFQNASRKEVILGRIFLISHGFPWILRTCRSPMHKVGWGKDRCAVADFFIFIFPRKMTCFAFGSDVVCTAGNKGFVATSFSLQETRGLQRRHFRCRNQRVCSNVVSTAGNKGFAATSFSLQESKGLQ